MAEIVSISPDNQFDFPQNFHYVSESDTGLPAMKRTPGLSTWIDLTGTLTGKVRAMKVIGNYLYALIANTLYKITDENTYSSMGTVSTSTGPAQIEGNSTQVAVLVCNVNYYVLTVATSTLTLITQTSDTPPQTLPVFSTMTYADNYIILNSYTDKAFFYVTDATGDLSLISALDYETAFRQSDDIVSVKIGDGELFVCGAETLEVYQNTGATFPYTIISGADSAVGCGAALSQVFIDNGLFLLDNLGRIRKTVGYKTYVISTPKLDRAISAMTTVSDAIGMGITWGHAMWYVITFPSENVTYAFDCIASAQLSDNTKTSHVWYKWASYPNDERHRANCFVYFNRVPLVGDHSTAVIWKLDSSIWHENGESLVSILTLPKIDDKGKPIIFDNYYIDMKTGVGLAEEFALAAPDTGVEPVISLDYSNDDGQSWVQKGYRSIGKYGETSLKVHWNMLGMTRKKGRVFKHTISDPVECTIYGARVNV